LFISKEQCVGSGTIYHSSHKVRPLVTAKVGDLFLQLNVTTIST